MNGVRKLDFF